MADANGSKLMVNTRQKKHTHLLIDDQTGRFHDSNPTTRKVTSVEAGGGTSFTIKQVKVHNKKTLTVITHSPKAKGKAKPYATSTPDMLAVTITTGAMPVPVAPIPVVLIDDDGCGEP